MLAFPKYETYRDSNFDWLGEIPEGWQTIRAKYILEEIDERSKTGNEELLSVSHLTGVTPRAEKNVNMFLAEDYTGAKLCQTNDVVINTMWAWMGALGVSPMEGLVSPSYGVYRPNEKVFPKFLDSLLRTPQYIAEYIRRSTGIHSSRLRLYPNQFLDIPLLLPPLSQQKRIVEFIDRKTSEIDQAIAQKQRLIELLQEQKAILINQAVTKGLNPNVPMRDSDIESIGKIPKHWKIVRLKHLSRKITDGEHISPRSVDTGIPLLSAKDVRERYIRFDEANYVSYSDAEKFWRRCKPEKGDLLIVSRGATVGRIGLVEVDTCFCLMGSVILVKLKNTVYPDFMYFSLNQDAVQRSILQKSDASAQQAVYLIDVKETQICLPPEDEQKTIAIELNKVAREYDEMIEIQNLEINRLQEFKNVLISNAVTGKLKV